MVLDSRGQINSDFTETKTNVAACTLNAKKIAYGTVSIHAAANNVSTTEVNLGHIGFGKSPLVITGIQSSYPTTLLSQGYANSKDKIIIAVSSNSTVDVQVSYIAFEIQT